MLDPLSFFTPSAQPSPAQGSGTTASVVDELTSPSSTTHPAGSSTTGIGPTRTALIAREHAPPSTSTPTKDHGDTIVPHAPPAHPDLRDAAAKFGPNAASAHSGAANHAMKPTPSGTTPPKGSDTSKQGSWLYAAGDFAKGVGEGALDGASGMVQGVGDLAKGAYHLATSADARSHAADTIGKSATAAGQFAKTAVTDPAKAASQVSHVASSAANSVSTAYHQAAANGHGSEFIGKIAGQGALLAATLPFGGAEAEGAAAVGDVGRIAEAAADLGKGGGAMADADKALHATDAASNATSDSTGATSLKHAANATGNIAAKIAASDAAEPAVAHGLDLKVVDNQVSPNRRSHILDGDNTGGGHRAGTGKAGKSEFPSSWPDDKIIKNLESVANDASSSRTPGRNGRTIIRGNRDGIDLEVIVGKNHEIVTGYPTNVPRNSR